MSWNLWYDLRLGRKCPKLRDELVKVSKLRLEKVTLSLAKHFDEHVKKSLTRSATWKEISQVSS